MKLFLLKRRLPGLCFTIVTIHLGQGTLLRNWFVFVFERYQAVKFDFIYT